MEELYGEEREGDQLDQLTAGAPDTENGGYADALQDARSAPEPPRKRKGRKTAKENLEILEDIANDETLFASERSFAYFFRVIAYNPWLSCKMAYLVWYQVPNAMRVASQTGWEQFAEKLGVEKPFKYGDRAIALYMRQGQGSRRLVNHFDVSQTHFKLLPVSFDEYRNEELFFAGALEASPAFLMFVGSDNDMESSIVFDPLIGELRISSAHAAETSFETYFQRLVSEVCHSILADGDAAYDKEGSEHICDMCYLIVSFAYNIRYKPGFSERAGDEYREAELRYFEEAQWDEIRSLDSAGLFDAIKCARSAALKIIDGITRKGLTPASGKLKVDKRKP